MYVLWYQITQLTQKEGESGKEKHPNSLTDTQVINGHRWLHFKWENQLCWNKFTHGCKGDFLLVKRSVNWSSTVICMCINKNYFALLLVIYNSHHCKLTQRQLTNQIAPKQWALLIHFSLELLSYFFVYSALKIFPFC